MTRIGFIRVNSSPGAELFYWLVPLVWFLGFIGFSHLYIQLYPVTLPQYSNLKRGEKAGIWGICVLWPISLFLFLPVSALAWLIKDRSNPFRFGAVYQRAAEKEAERQVKRYQSAVSE